VSGARTYDLTSGERQTGTTLEAIRADHRLRYDLAAEQIAADKRFHEDWFGMDVFCGNGYGSYLLAGKTNICMMGIDASREAILVADSHYSTERTFFVCKEFPFRLPSNRADIVVSFESLEHVNDYAGFLDTLVDSLKSGGLLFLSTPNEKILSNRKNPNRFHFRHFTQSQVMDEVRMKRGLALENWYGQNVYHLNSAGRISGCLPEHQMKIEAETPGQFEIYVFRKP